MIRPTDKHVPTDAEVAAFLIVADQYGLNPFTREIHAFSDRGIIVPIVGIDGWARIVNRQPDFDGVEFTEQRDEKGELVSMTCIVHVKNRTHPVKVTEWIGECRRSTIPWNTMPHRMLRHKAFIQAARIAFGLSGIYDEDEARDIIRNARISSGADLPLGVAAATERLATAQAVSPPLVVVASAAAQTDEEAEPAPAAAPAPTSAPPEPDIAPEDKRDTELFSPDDTRRYPRRGHAK